MASDKTSESQVLKYQEHRTLDDVPAYHVYVQLRLTDSNQIVFVGAKQSGFDVYFDPSPALHYDGEGRFIKWAECDQFHRRSLSHRVLETRKLPRPEGGIRRRVLPEHNADELVTAAAAKISEVVGAIESGCCEIEFSAPAPDVAMSQIAPLLKKAAVFDADAAQQDATRFFTIYRPVAILPPDQYNALVLQATEGCAYNQCAYCGFYRQTKFHIKSAEEFAEHVEQVIAFHGSGLANRRGIFIEQANALNIPQSQLLDIFGVLNRVFAFPPEELRNSAKWWLGKPLHFDGVYSFIDTFSGVSKTAEDYSALRELNLRRVYLGMETGDEALLKFLNKPATRESILRVVRRLKEGGLQVGVIVLVGPGGEAYYESHIGKTVSLINQMNLGKGDYIYLSPLVDVPGSEYFERAREAGIYFLSEERIDEQEKAIRAGISSRDSSNRPVIARYDIEQFVY